MRGSGRFLACPRRTRYAVYVYVSADDAGFQGRQHGKLYAGGKATWVGKVAAAAYRVPVGLRQAIYIVVRRCRYAEVLRQVDDLHVRWYGVLAEECLALSMPEAEEHHVDLVEWHVGGEPQVCLSLQPTVYVRHQVAGIALAIGKDHLRLWVVEQQAQQLAACIARGSQYSNPNAAHRDVPDNMP